MKLVANIKLEPSPEQAEALQATLERCNAACNYLAQRASEKKVFRQFALQKLAYREVREKFELTAQAAVRCIAKVADTYRSRPIDARKFRKFSAQPFDDRIFRFAKENTISIWTLAGRQHIAFICGPRQKALLAYRKGEVDLMFIRGKWYVACVCDVPDPETIGIRDVLGIDLGVVNLAVDSEGETFSGASVEANRRRYEHRRRNLQRKKTRAARVKLRTLSGSVARFARHTNHCISKAIVTKAERLCAAIALEDLKGIRNRIKANRRQRARLHSWGFNQLRAFIAYKGALAGIPVVTVDPYKTSMECPSCGFAKPTNRRTRDHFHCVSCGLAGAADHIAARNIRARAVANRPEGFAPELIAAANHKSF